MKVLVDDVWASPSTLHLRVTVHDDEMRWRNRFYEAIPLETIPDEAMAHLIAYWMEQQEVEPYDDPKLF